jgi:hypothetical protein
MAYPQFTKAGHTPLIFSRGELFPKRRPRVYALRKNVSEGQVAEVVQVGPREEWVFLHFERLPFADFTALRDWLDTLVTETFTFTDDAGTAFLVRWWPDNNTFEMPEVASALYAVDVQLRVEG